MWTGFVAVCLCAVLLTIESTVTTRQGEHDEFVNKVKQEHDKDGHHNKDFDRDVIWGDEKINYEDGEVEVEKLNPEEQKKRLRALVRNRIDKDKDGYVSMDELVDWTERSYNLFETEETREMFPDADRDKDGAIQWKEYAEDTFGAGFEEESPDFKDPPSVEWEEFVKTYKKDKRKFEAADLDGNGDLSIKEFEIFKHPRLHKKTEDFVIDETLESSDLNKDGVIDVTEFLGDFERKEGGEDPSWTLMEKEKFEAELDVDKDGVLNRQEILHWVSPNNHDLAAEEAEHLMDETDRDRDDRLTVQEILDNHVDWVDSDATDYGRQLMKHHDEL